MCLLVQLSVSTVLFLVLLDVDVEVLVVDIIDVVEVVDVVVDVVRDDLLREDLLLLLDFRAITPPQHVTSAL